jgi:hypothetical protein
MPHELQPVRPGDLITAQAWNDLLLKIEEIEQRIEDLEESDGGGNSLVITGRIPANGPYRLNDQLVLDGGNFQFSLGATQVFLNSVRVLDLTGSTDTRLIFVIPPVPGVVEPGTEVTLHVFNQTEEVTQQIVLRPAQFALFGEVDITWLSVNPTTPQSGNPVTFAYRLTSRASVTADFVIPPFISPNNWPAQLLDSNLNPIPGLIRLNPLQQQLFNVRISIPGDTQGTPFTLTANAFAGVVNGSAGVQTFTVGQQAETPDPTITLNPRHVPGGAQLEGDTVWFISQGGGGPRLRFAAEFEAAGTYDLTVEATNGWTVVRAPQTPASYVISAQDIPAGGRAVRFPEIDITPGGLDGRTTVRLQRRGAANSRSVTLNLIHDVS